MNLQDRNIMRSYYIYILQCNDETYYTGVTSNLEERLRQHESGYGVSSYTSKRRPVKLVFSQQFHDITQAITLEKQIKGWTRKKKEALINGEWERLKLLSKNHGQYGKIE